ncbi:MAG: hypothetical protein E6K16_05655 [Methanobacteriota archaeon]|nr:MAG: hypothetical protein E6K16_05655 [Euryarchaeota archaeon]
MAGRETFYCYACLRGHETDSAIGRSHARFDIDADASTSAVQSHIREFYLQTKGVQAAFRILGFEGVRIHPPRFGGGWPPREEIERRYRGLVKRSHPDAGGNPEKFRRVQWAIEILRRYRPPEEYRSDAGAGDPAEFSES